MRCALAEGAESEQQPWIGRDGLCPRCGLGSQGFASGCGWSRRGVTAAVDQVLVFDEPPMAALEVLVAHGDEQQLAGRSVIGRPAAAPNTMGATGTAPADLP